MSKFHTYWVKQGDRWSTLLFHRKRIFQVWNMRTLLTRVDEVGVTPLDILKNQYDYVEIYYMPAWHSLIMAPRKLRWVKYILEFRDKAARSWAEHLVGMGLLKEYEVAPWPKCLKYGWEPSPLYQNEQGIVKWDTL